MTCSVPIFARANSLAPSQPTLKRLGCSVDLGVEVACDEAAVCREEMEASVDAFYAAREAEGVPVRYTHRLGEDQWGYNDWLCEQCGPDVAKLPGWRSHMHKIGQGNIKANPESYRDSWPEPMVVAEGELAAQEWRDHQIAAAC